MGKSWSGKFKYGVSGDPLLTGHVTQPYFGPKIAYKDFNSGDDTLLIIVAP